MQRTWSIDLIEVTVVPRQNPRPCSTGSVNGDAFASKKGVFVPLRYFSKCLAYSFQLDFLLFLLVVVEWLARLKSSFGVFAVGCGYFPHP